MVRRQRQIATPDSGYEFKCQSCEGDVFQITPPKLVMSLQAEGSGRGKILRTYPLQCCQECAEEVEKENLKIQKKHKLVDKQVIALRLSQELDTVLPPDAKPRRLRNQQILDNLPVGYDCADDPVETKLDKVIDALTGLTQLLLAQAQQNVVLQPPTKQPEISREEYLKIMTEGMEKSHAESKAEKPKVGRKAPAKTGARTRKK